MSNEAVISAGKLLNRDPIGAVQSDGKPLAFTSVENGTLRIPGFSIQVSEVQSGDRKVLLLPDADFRLLANLNGNPSIGTHPAFSLDDKHIVVRRGGENSEAFVQRVSSGEDLNTVSLDMGFPIGRDLKTLKQDGDDDNWAKRYRACRIASPELAIAPMNPNYLDWRAKHPDPKREYSQIAPRESADDQRVKYFQQMMVPDSDKKNILAIAMLQKFCPLIVPSKAWIEKETYIKNLDSKLGDKYLHFIVNWKAELVDTQNPRIRNTNHILYESRWHTNTNAKYLGVPPSVVLSRSYEFQGRRAKEYLVAPCEAVAKIPRPHRFESSIVRDGSGNIWLSEDARERAIIESGMSPVANEFLKESHHFCWTSSIGGK